MNLADVIRRSQKLSPSAKAQYVASIERFVAFVGPDPSGWTPLAVEAWRDSLASTGMRPQSVNTHFYALRYASKRWAALGLGDNFAAAAEALRPEPPAKRHRLSEDEIEALLTAIGTADPPALRDRAVVIVGLQCGGRRVAELASLTWERVGPEYATFRIKGGRDHAVPMDTSVRIALDAWQAASEQSSGHVFRSLRRGVDDRWRIGESMSEVAIYQALRVRATQAGIRKVHPHLLRHTFVMRCFDAGVPVHIVMQMTGHKSLQSLSWYVEKNRAANEAAADLPALRLRK